MEIKTRRVLEYYFGQFSKIYYKNNIPFVEVLNPITSERKSFRYGHVIDNKINLKTLCEVKKLQSSLITKGFDGEVKLYPLFNSPDKNKWLLECPICSKDIFVENKLCNGLFPCRLDSLKNGCKPCRCSDKYRYSYSQWEFRARETCNEAGYTFLRLEGIDKRDWKIKYKCSMGHERCSFMKPFIIQGKRCKLCSQDAWNSSGFYPLRIKEEDNLYLASFELESEKFLKIGRTFNLHTRLYHYPKEYTVTYIATTKGLHGDIYKEEQRLQGLCNQWHYTPSIHFQGAVKECFIEGITNVTEVKETFNLDSE